MFYSYSLIYRFAKISAAVSAVCFEVLGQLVKICTVLLDGFSDAHGRSSLLTTYIHYHKISLKGEIFILLSYKNF